MRRRGLDLNTVKVPIFDTATAAPVPLGYDSEHSGHLVQFYTNDNFLIDSMSRRVEIALGEGGAAIVIVTEDHRAQLARCLESRGISVDSAVHQGRYVALGADETLPKIMRDRRPDADVVRALVANLMAQAASAGVQPARVFVFGEMVALLWMQGNAQAAIEIEHLWNELQNSYGFRLHCAYPLQSFDRTEHAKDLTRICQVHSAVIPSETYSALVTDQERLRNIAELQQKAQALETATGHLQAIIEQRTSALRRLSVRILGLQDAERRRIARELHDSLGQYLTGLKIDMDMLQQAPFNDSLWAQAEELLSRCLTEVRTLSYLLHPPMMDEAGLSSAARWYLQGFGERSGIKVNFETSDDLDRLPDSIEVGLFRILQEALTNVHRHAAATETEVRILGDAEQVILEIRDNGQGMPQDVLARFAQTGASSGVGLTGIHERVRELGGWFRVTSDDKGTSLLITVPVPANQDEHKIADSSFGN